MKKSPYPRFSAIYQNGLIFCTKANTCGIMSAPIGSRHMATETPARGWRKQGWRGWFLSSTEWCPSRCVRVKVHQRARRLNFLCLGMPCVALIRRPKIQPLRLHLILGDILHSTCRASVLLVGVELVSFEGRILNLVQYSGDSNSGLLRGCGVDVDKKNDHGDPQARYCYQ